MGIIEKLGKFHSIATPGFTCFLFPCTQMAGRLSTRVQQLDVSTDTKVSERRAGAQPLQSHSDCLMADDVVAPRVWCDRQTKDNVTVTVRIAVQYRVINERMDNRRESIQTIERESSPKTMRQSGGTYEAISTDMERGGADYMIESHGATRAFYRLTDVEMQLMPYVEDVVRAIPSLLGYR
jgi:hypothetical protein